MPQETGTQIFTEKLFIITQQKLKLQKPLISIKRRMDTLQHILIEKYCTALKIKETHGINHRIRILGEKIKWQKYIKILHCSYKVPMV